jgi:GWxTD domain-containing protein
MRSRYCSIPFERLPCYRPVVSIPLVVAAALFLSPAAPRHREWLEDEVHFVISSRERAQFEKLEEMGNDEERDRFIELFWARRAREGLHGIGARETHRRRLAECDRLFAEGGLRGRFTERGRIFQNLGAPAFRETFGQTSDRIVPAELWQYTGVALSPLPDSFYLLFFRARGDVRYRLWSPVADGLAALLPDAEPNRFQTASRPEALERIDPELAAVVRSLTRGEESSSLSLLATLANLPDLLERGRTAAESVRARASFRAIDASLEAVLLDDDAGIAEVHYALQFPSSELVGQARTRITLEGRLLGRGGEVDRWEDRFEIRGREGTAPFVGVLSIEGRRVAAPGSTRLVMTLVSDGIASASSSAELGRLFLARSVREDSTITSELPFRGADRLASPLAGSVVRDARTLGVLAAEGSGGNVRWTIRRGEETLWRATDELRLPFATTPLPLQELPAGVYLLEASSSGGAPYEREFEWRPEEETARFRVLARERTGSEEASYRYRRAASLRGRGERERAIEELEKATEFEPESLRLQLELAALRYAAGRYEDVVEQLSKLSFVEDTKVPLDLRLDLLVLQAGASEALGRFERAVALYEEAARLAPGNVAYATAVSRARARASENVRRDR